MNVNIIQTVDEGIVNDPILYANTARAEEDFEIIVMEHGFRQRKKGEKFDKYFDAFKDWEDSPKCTYDLMDWEIHFWGDGGIEIIA